MSGLLNMHGFSIKGTKEQKYWIKIVQGFRWLVKVFVLVSIFRSKLFIVLEILTFFPWVFGYAEKRLDKKAMVNFKIFGVTDWAAIIYNIHIAQYLKK